MALPDQRLTLTTEDMVVGLREFPKDEGGAILLGTVAIGMGSMMNLEGERGEMSKNFLDAVVELGKSVDKEDKILAVKLGMLFQQGKKFQDEEAVKNWGKGIE
jgi:hypothetical protein